MRVVATLNTSRRRWLKAAGAVGAVGAAVAAAVGGWEAADSARVISASYPEGPLYVGEVLYYAEMGADTVTVVESGTPRRLFEQDGCGPTAIAQYGGGFLVLCHIGRRIVALSSSGQVESAWAETSDGQAFLNPNDASADGNGGVYLSDPGTFSRDSNPEGRIIYVSSSGSVEVVADGLWYPNGVFVDRSAGRLLVSEHLAGRVLSFDILVDGSLGQATTFADTAEAPADRFDDEYREAGPDGLEIGPRGEVYVAIYGEGRIIVLGSSGEFLREHTVPTRFVTNIAFANGGMVATTGAFDNRNPPYAGEVRLWSLDEPGEP